MIVLNAEDWMALLLSLKLAFFSTIILLVIAIPLAWWLAFKPSKLKAPVAALITLPLILPPSVIGFYLLIFMAPQDWLGKILYQLGIQQLSFSFSGLLIASLIYSLPFVVQPIQNTFISIGKKPLELATCLGATPKDAFFNAFLPQAKIGIISAAILGFAHTLGEFGIVLMIGGNIPNKTQLASIQIYNHVEAMEYSAANQLALILLIFSFATLIILYWLNHKLNFWNKI